MEAFNLNRVPLRFRSRTLPLRAWLWTLSLCATVVLARNPTPTPTPKAKAKGDGWWSLKPVLRPALPDGAPANPIDRFLQVEFRRRGIQPVGPAEKQTLLRRVHLDLVGLPPTPAEQEAFLADTSPDAYGKVVDRLLADPQHAVRYARHWLDVLRYADTDERMTAAPGIHLWRDWVIQALHEDVPYDQFVQVQLSGRRAQERTQMSATGHRSRREPRPGDEFALGFLARGTGESPQDLAIAAADTVSTAFMGMTVGCAKCHNHMYDPISKREYYAMKALFDPLVLRKVTLASADERIAAGKAQAEVARRRAPLEKELEEFTGPFRSKLREDRVLMLPSEVQVVIRKSERQRTVEEQKIADDYFPILRIDDDKLREAMPDEARKRYQELQRRLNASNSGTNAIRVPNLPVFHTVEVDRQREQEKSYILTSGDPTRPELDHEVKPGWPFSSGEPDFRDGRIEAFADWLTAPENPLFARVAVNRLWQWHFGEGLHRSVSDFGELGGVPSHPELLDWLASEFVRSGYSMRTLHRLMVTSEAYRRASVADTSVAENQRLDPGNTTLWRFRLQRLEAEPIWDLMHSAVGDLDLKVGGPSFDPGTVGEAPLQRRGVYIVRGYSSNREVTPDFLQSFDVDDGRAPCPVRTQTVTAPQALFLMNSAGVARACAGVGARLRRDTAGDLTSAVDLAFRTVLSRPPSAAERQSALAYLEGDPDRLDRFAWLLFNLDEFLYVQ